MSTEDLSHLREFATELAYLAGRVTLRYFQTDVGVECGARGDMAVYVECNSLHSLAGTHGDDGH